MKVTQKDIEYIAKLSKLKLNENEMEEYVEDLNKIIGYVEKLNELDTSNVEPLSHPVMKENAFREDVVKTSIDRNKVLKNAPEADDEYFRVPKVINQKRNA